MSCADCLADDCHPDCPHQVRCPSCGTAYTHHLGLVGTCAELVAARKAMARARAAILRIWPDPATCQHEAAREALNALEGGP